MNCSEMAKSEDYFDVIAMENPDFVTGLIEGEDYCRVEIDSGVSIFYLTKEKIRGYSLQNYGYQLIPKIYAPQAQRLENIKGAERLFQNTLFQNTTFQNTDFQVNESLEASGILQVQQEPLNLTGLNTLIGIIDTGIRYQLPLFMDENGNTKIVSFWNQEEQTGPPPEGFLYGTEYNRERLQRMIEEAGQTDNLDRNGHGTALASVMVKASPLAELVVVKCRKAKPNLLEYYGVADDKEAYSEVELLQAVKYLVQIAARENKPMVICLGLGSNYGPHDGDGALQQYLERVGMKSGIVVVTAAGNENTSAHHCKTNKTVEIRVEEGNGSFLLECWSEVTNRYRLTLRTPGGEVLEGLDARNGMTATYEFVFDQTLLFISTSLVERGSGRSLIIIRFQNPTSGIWSLQFEQIGSDIATSQLDLWLPVDEFLQRPVFFLSPSTETTVTEPGTARRVITIGAYQVENESLAPFSGRGPTINGNILPDLCGPGVEIETVMGIYTGTGIACAFTAGAISLFLEWAYDRRNIQFISSEAVRNFFILGASRDNRLLYPNNSWGYGRLDLYGVFEKIAGF